MENDIQRKEDEDRKNNSKFYLPKLKSNFLTCHTEIKEEVLSGDEKGCEEPFKELQADEKETQEAESKVDTFIDFEPIIDIKTEPDMNDNCNLASLHFNNSDSNILNCDGFHENDNKSLSKSPHFYRCDTDPGPSNPTGRFFKCSECDYSNHQKYVMRNHVNRVHLSIKPFQCELCAYKASKHCQLKSHWITVHSGFKLFQCTFCDYSASNGTNLKRHISSVHRREKPYPCPQCDFCASHSTNLKRHIVSIHKKEKPYACHQCDYKSAQSSGLKRHILSVHKCEKPHACSFCHYKAIQRSDLNKHISLVHVNHPLHIPSELKDIS